MVWPTHETSGVGPITGSLRSTKNTTVYRDFAPVLKRIKDKEVSLSGSYVYDVLQAGTKEEKEH